VALPPPLPWDLDRLPAEILEAASVPGCWYLHRHLVHRLAAVMWWRAAAYQPPTEGEDGKLRPGARAKDAADWWASSTGLAGWLAAFRELACKGRPSGHRDDSSIDDPASSFRKAVATHVRSTARSRPPTDDPPAASR
jgi:hypothetical protein